MEKQKTTIEVFYMGYLAHADEYSFEPSQEEVREDADNLSLMGFITDWDEVRVYVGGPDACNGEPNFIVTKERPEDEPIGRAEGQGFYAGEDA